MQDDSRISGDRVIWTDLRNSDWVKRQVYYYDFSHLLEEDGG